MEFDPDPNIFWFSLASLVIFTGGGSNLSYFRTGPENPKSVFVRTKLPANGLVEEDVRVDDPNLKLILFYCKTGEGIDQISKPDVSNIVILYLPPH